MKIWIVGARGMLGSQLSRDCAEKKWELVLSDKDVDITSFEDLKRYAPSQKPDVLVNCAAYTAVDQAETDQEQARSLNADGAANLARLAHTSGIPLIHISTDYVLQGKSPAPIDEEEPYNPINYYGRTKMWGEMAIRERCPKHIILRTAWLYGARGKHFVGTMLQLLAEKEQIRVVDDQFGSPTSTAELSRVIIAIAGKCQNSSQSDFPWGMYHASGEGHCSWYEFACEIRQQALELGVLERAAEISPVSGSEFPTPAARPAWSVMSKNKLKTELNISFADWKPALHDYLRSLAAGSGE